jgi:hypothetical protein
MNTHISSDTKKSSILLTESVKIIVMLIKKIIWIFLFILVTLSPNLLNSKVIAGEWTWYMSGGNNTYGCNSNAKCPATDGNCNTINATKTKAKCACDKGPGEWMTGYYRCKIPQLPSF